MSKGYDWLAPWYDWLAVMAVGKQIQKAQLKWLPFLKDRKKLLILGGGTGWVLPYIFQINPNLVIHYIDASSKMIAKARMNADNSSLIQFIAGTETDVPDQDYDALLTCFYLDLFTEPELKTLIDRLKSRMNQHGIWLATDFETHTLWQRLKVRLMYLFFYVITGLKTKALPAWHKAMVNAGCVSLENHYTRSGLIRSVVFLVKNK